MRRRLVILTEIISPYRIPLFNTLARDPQLQLHVIFLADTDPTLRQWEVYKQEIEFSYSVLPSWRRRIGKFNVLLNRGLRRKLVSANPDAILCGGYNYLASWQALRWARAHKVPFFLWSESNSQDQRRGHALVEGLKSNFIRQCTGFVAPGVSARAYLRSLAIKDDRIFTAPNAVDNRFFAEAAAAARGDSAATRRELELPDRYWLFVGRLVREKGVFELLSAYAKLEDQLRQRIGLVYVGEGSSRRQLEAQAASIPSGMIRFAGFAQRDRLAAYYAMAEALVLPTYTDTWGLVVNEAMACGLPVIVSRVAGCAADLVKENWNGVLIEPRDVDSLARALTNLGSNPELCETMGVNSTRLIAGYSPAEWSAGICLALRSVGEAHE